MDEGCGNQTLSAIYVQDILLIENRNQQKKFEIYFELRYPNFSLIVSPPTGI